MAFIPFKIPRPLTPNSFSFLQDKLRTVLRSSQENILNTKTRLLEKNLNQRRNLDKNFGSNTFDSAALKNLSEITRRHSGFVNYEKIIKEKYVCGKKDTSSKERECVERGLLNRLKYKCNEKPQPIKKLSFRETTREECIKCSTVPYVQYCPELVRPKATFDSSQLQWKHKICPPEKVETPLRSDAGLKVRKKKLPSFSRIGECMPFTRPPTPNYAPKLVPPPKRYDPTETKIIYNCKPLQTPVERLDDILGLKVLRKKLPKLEPNDCTYVHENIPKYAPKLERLKARYDQSKMTYKHKCIREDFDLPERMDDILCYQPTKKILPSFFKYASKPNCDM